MNSKIFEEMMVEFRECLKIDRNSLDDAVEQHAELYLRVQEQYVLAKSVVDERKSGVDEEYAYAGHRTREAMAKTKEKWTEAQIKEAIVVDKQYLSALSDFYEKKKQAELLGAMAGAYDQRSKMLRELSALYQAGYFVLQSTRSTGNNMKDVDARSAREALNSARATRPTLGRFKKREQ